MSDLFEEPPGATPIPIEQRDTLKQTWITSRADLNIAERDNITKGASWARRQRGQDAKSILAPDFSLRLHREMFGEVWTWAGLYRIAEVMNIGLSPHLIEPAVHQLFGDVAYQIEHKSYGHDELAVRLHHRLVAIHPFTNGNGRQTRLMADLLIEQLDGKPFSWGGEEELANAGDLRRRYIEALRAADNNDIQPLLDFARS